MAIQLKALVFVLLAVICANSVFSYTVLNAPRYKGELSRDIVISMYIDAMVTKYLEKTEGLTWNESTGNYNGISFNADELQNLWAWCGNYIAFDGTDAQVARTGLSREELFRRSELTQAKSYPGKTFEQAKAQYLAEIQNANEKWPQEPVAPVSTVRPGATKVYMGFNQFMDYGASDNWFTLRAVPQDFADPRMVGGKSIKEWMMGYKFTNGGLSGHPMCDSGNVEACYAPDFTGDHHNLFNEGYPLQSPMHGQAIWKFVDNVTKGLPVQLQWKSALSHMDDQGLLALRHTGMHGWYCSAGGMYFAPIPTEMLSAWLYSVFGDKNALAFLAKSLETEARHENTNNLWNGSLHGCLFEVAWYLLRYTGVDLGPCPNYKEASKVVHGSYWYKYFRYGVHRTPDKLVTVGWNGKSRKLTAQGLRGFTEYSDVDQSNPWAFYSPGSMPQHTTGMSPAGDFVVTQVIPDNADSLPENEAYLVRAQGRMQGCIDNINYNQAGIEVRENRSDAVLSTAGDMDILGDSYSFKAKQYQSFTSFYDKTSISMIQIKPGKNGQGQLWMGGFSTSFHADKNKPVSGRTCFFEGDSVDLNVYAVTTTGSENAFYAIGGLQKNLTGSKWWSMNGRLGMAVLGGDQGGFKVYSAYSGGASRWGLYDPATMIGYEAALGAPDAKGNQLDMVAAYFTDTPPAKVKALQATLKSIDSQLPDGWKGVTSSTPDDQRVLALVRFYGANNQTANLKLGFPEGAPVLEAVTSIIGDTARASITFDALESWGQTMAFYVSGATDTVIAEQIGDITMRIKGNGAVTLKYLSRANANTVYVNGVASSKTKQELASGISITLTQAWTMVRVTNSVDEDHTGPAVEVVSPEYITQFNCRGMPAGAPDADSLGVGSIFWDPKKTAAPESGLKVKVRARDRSGVAYVKIFLDWVLVDSIVQPANEVEITIPKATFGTDSVHAIHAVACDNMGNEEESFSVPFKVTFENGSAIESISSRKKAYSIPSTLAGRNVSHAVDQKSVTSKGTKAFSSTQVSEAWIAQGRAKADADGITFTYGGVQYSLSISAKTNKVSLFRKQQDARMLVGESILKLSSGKWYDLKVKASDGHLAGYVNGEEIIAIKE